MLSALRPPAEAAWLPFFRRGRWRRSFDRLGLRYRGLARALLRWLHLAHRTRLEHRRGLAHGRAASRRLGCGWRFSGRSWRRSFAPNRLERLRRMHGGCDRCFLARRTAEIPDRICDFGLDALLAVPLIVVVTFAATILRGVSGLTLAPAPVASTAATAAPTPTVVRIPVLIGRTPL